MKKIKKLYYIIPAVLIPVVIGPTIVSCSTNSNNSNIGNISVSISSPNNNLKPGETLIINSNLIFENESAIDKSKLTYKWEYKLNNQNNWTEFKNNTNQLVIEKIHINYNNSVFKLSVIYDGKIFYSNELSVNVNSNGINPIETVEIHSNKTNYNIGDNLIINSDVKILESAVDNLNNIKYIWEQNLPGVDIWTPIDTSGNVLSKKLETFEETKAKYRVIADYCGVQTVSNVIDLNKIIPFIKPDNNYSLTQVADDGLTSIGINEMTVVEQKERTIINNQYYNSDVWAKYHKDYGFIYPGWNRNYEQGNLRYFHNSAGQTIDAKQLVYNERVTDNNGNFILDSSNNKIKYNDSNWISSEIRKGTLKKHHAADNFFRNPYQYAPSTTMHYNISTALRGPITIGLFAPPGEVVTLEFDDDTWELIKRNNFSGLEVVINENFWDNRKCDDSGGISNRYPFLESVFRIDPNSKTLKVGSPFGGGLSLRINSTIYQTQGMPFESNVQNLGFSISGAIRCMFYQDGVTTPAEWEQQKELVKANQLAPILQALAPYHALQIPFTNLNQIANHSIDSLPFPKLQFKKWNDFLYLSNYFAQNDWKKNLIRINMEFCDDIWGGAGAWGGGNSFYCPVGWGIETMFANNPQDVFNAGSSWGVFHEINHNFQQDSALFAKRGHGETNQVTAFDLSVISDAGRFRSEINWTGEQNKCNDPSSWAWTKLNNSFTTIKNINSSGGVDEYPIYSILLFMLGSKRFVDYVRRDVNDHPCWIEGWSGFKEIQRLSETYKLNLWPAFENYGVHWRDSWPESTATATAEQKQVIKDLEKYPAVDFVGNLYAAGQYLYNCTNNQYEYCGDVISDYEIPAGNPYTFHFNDFVISTNQNFVWDRIELDSPTTKLGGSVVIDPTNPKNVIYTPNKNKVTEIDEFNVNIVPGQWQNKPANYVPYIKFKIKVRQIVNEPVFEVYKPFLNPDRNINDLFTELKSNNNFVYRESLATFKNPSMFINDTRRGIKIKYRFVAPKTGHYTFSNIWDDCIRVYVNNNPTPVFKNDNWTNRWTKTYEADLKKGQILDFETLVINTFGKGNFAAGVELNGQSIDLFSNVLIPNTAYTPNLNPVEVLETNKQNYKYKTRLVDRTIFNGGLSSAVNLSDYSRTIYEPDQYTLSSTYANVQNLNGYNPVYFENWNNDYGPNKAKVSFDVYPKFNTPVSSFYFGHRTNNHRRARPTHIKITGYKNNNHNIDSGIVMYDGVYPQRYDDYSIISLPKSYSDLTKIHIEAYNEEYNAIIWQWFRMSPDSYAIFGPSISVNNPFMVLNGNWSYKNNDAKNNSAINNMYVVSKNINDSIEFTLLNSQGFSIIGQNNPNLADFDVFVNDQKINFTKPTITNNVKNNQSLFNYRLINPSKIKVRIVHKDTRPLYLNYFMTFGPNSSIIKTI